MMRRASALLGAGVAAAALAVPAGAASVVDVTIRHQVRGCHAWAIGNGAYRASQHLAVRRGTTLVVANYDVMPHTLVQTGGPRVALHSLPSTMPMRMMGARAELTLTKPGTYRFTTRPGEDYMRGIRTVGPDNVLRLVVTAK